MKKIFTLIVVITLSTLAFAQQNPRDVVYMKDGTIIKGVIVENVPNEYVKIESGGTRYVIYQLDIKRIAKENSDSAMNRDSMAVRLKGYIEISLGPSVRKGDFAANAQENAITGLQINLVNFGYLFTGNIGIAASGFFAVNPLKTFGAFEPWQYGSLIAGPLISFPISKNAEWEFRPMIGYSLSRLPDRGDGYDPETDLSFACNIGTCIRFYAANSGKKVSISLRADYFSTKPFFQNNNFEQKISAITLGMGIAYNFN